VGEGRALHYSKVPNKFILCDKLEKGKALQYQSINSMYYLHKIKTITLHLKLLINMQYFCEGGVAKLTLLYQSTKFK